MCATGLLLCATGLSGHSADDPLPSCNGIAPRIAIIAFVEKVTKEGSSDLVAPNERIATFGNDGSSITQAATNCEVLLIKVS
jgi:hypothetical protein